MVETLSLYMLVVSFLSDMIYLQWLLFRHPFLVPERKIPFYSSGQFDGPDLNTIT